MGTKKERERERHRKNPDDYRLNSAKTLVTFENIRAKTARPHVNLAMRTRLDDARIS